MKRQTDNPFDSLESAYQYVCILGEVLEETRQDIEQEVELAEAANAARRLDALQLVGFKLERLRHHLDGSRRVLNDLKMLRRLLQATDTENLPAEPLSYNQRDALARDPL